MFLGKAVFLIYHFNFTAEAGFLEVVKVFFYGLRLDFSAAAYLMIFPLLLMIVSSIIRKNVFRYVIPWYFFLVITLLSLILAADIELYKFWGFRLDATPLIYLKTPREALASSSVWVIIRQIFIAIILAFVFILTFRKTFPKVLDGKFRLVEIPVFLFLFAALIIPIRGGFGIAPINVGSAYFSQNGFLNHAAINVFWNLGNSFVDLDDKSNNYKYFDSAVSASIIHPYLNNNDTSGIKVLKNNRPNILIVILESFSGNVIESIGGREGVTPSLNALSEEGILFRRMYSSGDRTDKGLISILSGYPAQATFSVIKDAARTQLLPKLPVDLKQIGYHTSFYYGGDLNFANMRSYLVSAGFGNLISMDDFPPETYNSKWGAHDNVVFDKLFQDINSASSPFFKVLLTLSSHEPFEVPTRHFKGTDEASRYLNSVMYTDSCVGDFIRKAKQQQWWENTWVIFVADHGSRHPENQPVYSPGKFFIPMLWTGGALNNSFRFDKTVSQADLPATILNQLGCGFTDYLFSRNVFGLNQKTDVFYLYNNGIGLVNDSAKLVFDCSRQNLQQKTDNVSESLINLSKAYIQTIYSDLNRRK